MSGTPTPVPRRTFLKGSVLGAAGAALASSNASAESRVAEATGGSSIPTRPFGQTGLSLPVLGMGGSALIANWNKAYGVDLPPLEERIGMIRTAFDRGIRYFDTARAYGESESIFGRALREVRDQCFIATKVHTSNPNQVRQSVETSLEQLQTDRVDLIQVHSPVIERVGYDGAMRVHEQIAKLRDEGICRYIGLTTHIAFDEVHQLIETGAFDQVLLAYGYFLKGLDKIFSASRTQQRDRCLAAAHRRGMAIVAMKVFGASIFGHNAKNVVPETDTEVLGRLPGAAIRWVLDDERVSMLNIGVTIPSDIPKNIETLTGDTRLTPDDRAILADFSQRAYESDYVKSLAIA